MKKIREVFRREYLERVKKKSFWITTFVVPFLILLFTFLPFLLGVVSKGKNYKIAVVDRDGYVKKNLDVEKSIDMKAQKGIPQSGKISFFISKNDSIEKLKKDVISKKIAGFIVVPKNFESKNISFYTLNTNNIGLILKISSKFKELAISKRLERLNIKISQKELKKIMSGIKVETFKISKKGKTKKSYFQISFWVVFSFIFILYMILLMYGSISMRGVIEEKSSKVMEVLLSIYSPFELMMGKLLGIGFVGLTQILVYMAFAGIIGVFVTLEAVMFLPQVADVFKNLNFAIFIYYIVFFLLGYFMYTSMFLGIGSLCSSEEDAQNIQTPVVFLIIIPFVSTIYLIQNPESTISVILSLIPFFTPMVMFMRVATSNPPFWQVLLSIVLTFISTIFIVRFSARIFRTGVLMYGKRPSFKEIVRWVRE